MQAYQKFLRGELPIKTPVPVQEDPPPPELLPGKKKYIPPYTPNRTQGFNRHHTNSLTNSRPSQNYRPRTVNSNRNPSQNRPSTSIIQNPPSTQSQVNRNSMNPIQQSAMNKKQKMISDEEALEVEMAVLPKRESSRRKAKDNSSKKMHMQERLLEDDDEEGQLPGLGKILRFFVGFFTKSGLFRKFDISFI